MEMPESTKTTPIPPSVVAAIDLHNLTLMTNCINRQSILIDVVEDIMKKRK